MADNVENRCRLVLISPPGSDWMRSADQIANAIAGGDVASLILWPGDLGEADYQKLCEAAVAAAQAEGIAAIVSGDSRVAGRSGADGVHTDDRSELSKLIDANGDQRIIGAGGVKTRHEALDIGEMRPDYVFFGRFGYDTKPEPHKRNLALAEWWAELVEVPCVVLAGSMIESVEAVAATGAEFAAVSSAVFTGTLEPGEAVRQANLLLDDKAPRFGDGA